MKAVDTKCPNCGAPLKVNMETHDATCEYCGSHIIFDDFEQSNSEFEENRQRAQQEQHQDYSYANPQPSARPRRRTLLWVLGWIFIFPIPLTIIIARNQNLKPWAKALIIIAAWLVYFIVFYGYSES